MASLNDVAGWLESLGLSTYREAFRDNDIDFKTLRLLTAEDLQQIGVTSVGHRRRLLAAIAELGAKPEADTLAASSPPVQPAEPRPPAARAAVVERRQMTVMFCDLVGSTELSTRLDPEDLHDLLAAYRACITEAVQRSRGFIAHYVGDGVFVYFGYPHAQEQDAERALRAGLAIIRAVSRLTPIAGAVPQVRIGVATGLVVVGNIAEGSSAEKIDVAGETPNLAARLQSLAGASQMVIAPSTRALVGDFFDGVEIGRVELKGLPEPVPAWRVTGERSVSSRYDALHSGRVSNDLIGRESELARLGDRWAAAKAGTGQVVLVMSEAGFGKSRLVEEVHRIAGDDEGERLVLQCSPDQDQTPLYPLIHQLEFAAGIATEDAAADRRDKLEALLKRGGLYSPERFAIVLDLLRVDAESATAQPAEAPADARGRRLRTLLELAETAMKRTSVLVAEDVHWADPSTVEFLDRLVGMMRHIPALLVVTARPEFAASWEDEPHVTTLRLDRLPPAELGRLVRAVAGPEELPPAVVEQIVARSDGVPLFAQELTRGILASGRSGGAMTIPSTLTESLLARLDGLDHGRETAQIAAVVGREFPIDLLIAVSPEEPEAVREAVARLLEAGIFVRRHSSFGAAAGFHHMLVRDAAYGLLLRRDRLRLHDKVALALEQRFPEIANAMPQLVAQHFAEAGNAAKAIGYLERAGADAAARSAPVEAVAHFERALELLATLPASPARDESGLGLRLDLIAPLIAARGHGSSDVAKAVDEALDLQQRLGSRQSIVPALTLKWLAQLGGGDIDGLHATAQQIKESAQDTSVVDRLLGHRTLGSALMFRGELVPAVEEFTAFLALYDPQQHDTLLARSGATNHAGVAMLCLAECFTLMGNRAESAKWREAVLAYSRERSHVPSLCQVLSFGGCWLSALLGDIDELVLYAAELRSVIARNNLEPWRPHVDLLSGLGDIHRGSVESGFALARRGIDALVAAKAFLLSAWALLFVEACERHGRTEDALAMLAVAESRIASGERWVEAEFLRLRGRLKRARGQPTAAMREDLEAALAVATRQGAGLLAERVRTDLAGRG
jgi:class 3 adenylate cyclase